MQQFKFEMGQLDPTRGTFANSQKFKVDEMKKWDMSPFHAFKCQKRQNHYVFLAKHDKVPCIECGVERTNKKCSNKMCKKCCVDKSIRATNQCKCKDHAKAAKKERDVMVEQEILVEGVDYNVPEDDE